MTSPIPAGWYPDQLDPAQERWYDGQQWSQTLRPKPVEFPFNAGPPLPQPAGAHSAMEHAAPDSPLDATPSPRKSRKVPLIIGGLVLLVIIAGAVLFSINSGGPAKATVTGSFVLTDSDTARARCVGQGGYADISPGVAVILTNEDGKILGSTILGEGKADTSTGTCTYSFSIRGVSESSAQYAVEVSHRGKVVNSRADMAANGWVFGISMGGN
jgi:hypothetical protein